ncbi:MAG TPA: Lrp/AsnC family transcriptional regulator [bacterium]|jgi:Lrp/AsnC family leucine-responsive transcriptional regulator|nr:Lrp/AsnC family transcriptional regulator [bacterium]
MGKPAHDSQTFLSNMHSCPADSKPGSTVEAVLDNTDWQILELLAENSRSPYAEVGRVVGLSRSAVADRVAKLINMGVIERFTVTINPEKIGKEISVFFEIQIEPNRLEEVAIVLAKRKEVTDVYQMTGSSTLHCHGLLKDGLELESFTREVLYALPGIKDVLTHVLLRRFKSRIGIRI